jgi:hypothetical protein
MVCSEGGEGANAPIFPPNPALPPSPGPKSLPKRSSWEKKVLNIDIRIKQVVRQKTNGIKNLL